MTLDRATKPAGARRGWAGPPALVLALLAALAVPLSGWGARPAAAAPAPAPVLHQWSPTVGVGDIALGPDGNMWFVATDTSGTPTKTGLGKITPAGAVTTYFDIWGTHCSTYYCQPNGLHFVGNELYVSEDFEGMIWDFSVASGSPVVNAGPVDSPGAHTPRQITDTGGYVYVTNYDGVNYFPANLSSGNGCWTGPAFTYDTDGIAVGPDGNIWTANGTDIGKVAPCTSGPSTPTYYSAGLSPSANLVDIVSAAGALWFTNSMPASATPVHDTIGRITTAGVITEYPVPSVVAPSQLGVLGMMAVAGDGSIWFTESNLSQVGRLSPADPSAITEYAMPDATHVSFLAAGPDGNVWYSGWSTSGSVIGELSLTPAADTPTSTTLASSRNPSTYGQTVTLTATVTPASGSAVPTGEVTFGIDGQSHTVAVDAAGHAAYTTGATELAVGLHAITASYVPASASGFAASTSTALQQRVDQPQVGTPRPDAWIRKHDWSGYLGNDVFNTTALRQTVSSQAHRTGARAFRVRVYNDGATDAVITVKATGSTAGAKVRYFTGGDDVTAAVTSPQGLTFVRAPGAFKGFRVRIDVGRHAAIGARVVAKVVATSGTGAATQKDAVKAVVTVVKR